MTKQNSPFPPSLSPFPDQCLTFLTSHNVASPGVTLYPSDIEFVLTNFDYGAKADDPIKNVRFYRKDGTTTRTTLRELRGIIDGPLDICQQNILVFARRSEVKDAIR